MTTIFVYALLPVVGSVFVLCSIFYGMECMGTDRNGKRTSRWMWSLGYSILATALSLLGNGILNLLVMLLIPVMGYFLFHSGKKYVMYYLILVLAVFFTDMAVILLLQTSQLAGLLYLNSAELYSAFLIVTDRLAEFFIIRLAVLAVRKNSGQSISARQFGVALILPAFTVLNSYTLLYCLQVYMTRTMIALFLLDTILLIGGNLYFCMILDTMSKNQQLENELNLFRQQERMQYRYYEREEQKYVESQKLIHDIKNHIQAMEELYRTDGAAKAERYAKSVQAMLNHFGQAYYTKDKLLNLILNDKVRLMQQYQIRADIKAGDIDLSFMKEMDITTLFANLLDNAVAAAKESRDSYIRLRICPIHQFTSVTMENSCEQEPKQEGGWFKSRKEGHSGIGLKNIKWVLGQYGGDVQYEWKAGIFYTRLLLVSVNSGEGREKDVNL